jgi:hypothetical protein
MHRKALTVAVCVLLIASARDAAAQAQTWTDRGYVNFSLGIETGSSGSLSGTRTFRLYDEDGTFNINQSFDSGALIDFSVGARVWQNVSAGIAFHRESTTGEGNASASVPDPLIFERPRQVTLDADDLKRTERAVHLQVGYMLPLNERLSVHLTGGPSFFRLTQDVIVVDADSFAESGGTVTFNRETADRSGTAVGFNIGGDVNYLFYQTGSIRAGVGAFLRYTGATVDIRVIDDAAGVSEVGSDVGGIQIGFGARVRF